MATPTYLVNTSSFAIAGSEIYAALIQVVKLTLAYLETRQGHCQVSVPLLE